MKKFLPLTLALALSLTACGGADTSPVAVEKDREQRIEKILESVPTLEPIEAPTREPVTTESLKVEVPEPEPVVVPEPVAEVIPEPVAAPVVPEPVQVVPVAPVVVPEPAPPILPADYAMDAPEWVEPVPVIPAIPEPVVAAPVVPPAPVVVPPAPVAGSITYTDDPALNCGGVGGGCTNLLTGEIFLSPSSGAHVAAHEQYHSMTRDRDECAAERYAHSVTGDPTMASYPECFGFPPR